MIDIKLHGVIVANDDAVIWRWFGLTDITCPGDIEFGLKEANGDDVRLLISSQGGSLEAGLVIRDMLLRNEGETTALICGQASSAATIAMTGCRAVKARPGTYICIHNPAAEAAGDHHTHERVSEALRNATDSLLDIYEQKSAGKKTRDEIRDLMDKDIYISPQQAIEYGIVDAIEEEAPIRLVASTTGLVLTDQMRQMYLNRTREEEKVRAELELLKIS